MARRAVRSSSEKVVRLRPKGQLTVPAKQLDLLGLRTGDQLIARVEGGRIVLEPGVVTRRSPRPVGPSRPKPTRAQRAARRAVLATIRPLSADEIDAIEPVSLRGAAMTDPELEAAISEGRE